MKKKSDPTTTATTTTTPTSKKLRLNRTTIRPLTTTELASVAAGAMRKGSKAEELECQTV